MKECAWLGVLLAFALAGPAQAQTQAVDTVYVGSHHSPWTAGVVEWVLPSAGFAYAGDWKRGLLPNAIRVASIVTIVAGAEDDGDSCGNGCAALGLTVVASTIWAVIGAVNTAHDHNARVREPRSFIMGPAPQGGVSLGFRLHH